MGGSQSQMCRVFCISDLHTDHLQNSEIVSSWANSDDFSKNDVLIVAGDISSSLEILRRTLELLTPIFGTVFFVPGNNELRLSRNDLKNADLSNSVNKFEAILKLCEELNVQTNPSLIFDDRVWIVPLFSWYTPFFDHSYDENDRHYTREWLDFSRCQWPGGFSDELLASVVPEEHVAAEHFRSLNMKPLADLKSVLADHQLVITFSHFLPRRVSVALYFLGCSAVVCL